MMKALILQGSPRKGGNTTIVCDVVAEAMTEAGAEVETLRAADMKIGGCIECYACQKVEDAPGCSVTDDMDAVYEKILAVDIVVLATPVFCWGMSAQIKAAIDRFVAFCKCTSIQADGKFKCLVDGKSVALVVTAGGGPYDGAEVCVAGYRAMAQFMRMDNRGELVAAPVGEPQAVAADKALAQRAAEFGRSLVVS